MQHLLAYLPLLACPVGMGLMMWMMMRGGHHGPKPPLPVQPPAMTPVQQTEIIRLRTEIDALRAEQRGSTLR